MDIKGHAGRISFDGRAVQISKQMRGRQTIPLSAIASVSIERAGLGMRAIRFAIAGGTLASPSVALGRTVDFANDPYSLPFRKKDEPKFQAFAELVMASRTSERPQ